MKINLVLVGGVALVAALYTSSSFSAINASIAGPAILSPTNTDDFEGFNTFPGEPLVAPSGFTFDCGSCEFVISIYGGTNALYQNGGSNSMTSIRLTSGEDISAISMENYTGFGSSGPTSHLWLRAYNNGSPVTSFLLPDTPLGSTITVWADGESIFDEVRIQAYDTPGSIDESEAQYGAIAIDNVIAGALAPIPVPPVEPPQPVPTVSVWGLGILAGLLGIIGFRRRIR